MIRDLIFSAKCALRVLVIVVFVYIPLSAAAEHGSPTDAGQKPFEAVVSFAQGISQWALLILAGSIVVVASTSYYRPRNIYARLIYLLFLPGWGLLAWSLYDGVSVQRVYLASLFSDLNEANLSKLSDALRQDSISQISHVQWGLFFFGIWLLFYFAWWLFNTEAPPARGQ
jgi:hypothetical protein